MKRVTSVLCVLVTLAFIAFNYQNCGQQEFSLISNSSNKADTDFAGIDDDDEISSCTIETNEDTDGDGLLDGEEVNTYNTDPCEADTDKGGTNDGDEIAQGTNPVDNPNDDVIDVIDDVDTDRDGLLDSKEDKIGTDKNNPDTDGDGLSDGREYNNQISDPLKFDTDEGGIHDGIEVLRLSTDPKDNEDDDPIAGECNIVFNQSLNKDALVCTGGLFDKPVVTFSQFAELSSENLNPTFEIINIEKAQEPTSECKIDNEEYVPCGKLTPVNYEDLSLGEHTLTLLVVDVPAGRKDIFEYKFIVEEPEVKPVYTGRWIVLTVDCSAKPGTQAQTIMGSVSCEPGKTCDPAKKPKVKPINCPAIPYDAWTVVKPGACSSTVKGVDALTIMGSVSCGVGKTCDAAKKPPVPKRSCPAVPYTGRWIVAVVECNVNPGTPARTIRPPAPKCSNGDCDPAKKPKVRSINCPAIPYDAWTVVKPGACKTSKGVRAHTRIGSVICRPGKTCNLARRPSVPKRSCAAVPYDAWTVVQPGACSSTVKGVDAHTIMGSVSCGPGKTCDAANKPLVPTRSCPAVKKPIDGGWSAWSVPKRGFYDKDSSALKLTRTCTNPAPAHGGQDCDGSAERDRTKGANRDCYSYTLKRIRNSRHSVAAKMLPFKRSEDSILRVKTDGTKTGFVCLDSKVVEFELGKLLDYRPAVEFKVEGNVPAVFWRDVKGKLENDWYREIHKIRKPK